MNVLGLVAEKTADDKGRFSYFVFKGLEGEADANSDGKISAGELHKYVRESVGRFSGGAQTPTMLGDAGRWVLR